MFKGNGIEKNEDNVVLKGWLDNAACLKRLYLN